MFRANLPEEVVGGPSPLLVVLSGPSGVGKDAVLNRMRTSGYRWHIAVTATTRPQRPGEKDGWDYHFIPPDRFADMIAAGNLLEWASVYGNLYGVPRQEVAGPLSRGQDVVVKVDVQGAASVRKAAPEAVLIFLAPPSLKELERRLAHRGTENPEALRVRLQTAREEMERLHEFDYVVVNHQDQVDATISQLKAIITAEKCRVHPRRARL